MENKYFNEAIIGNKKMLATYTSKGELQRLYFPSRENRQYISFFHTGIFRSMRKVLQQGYCELNFPSGHM